LVARCFIVAKPDFISARPVIFVVTTLAYRIALKREYMLLTGNQLKAARALADLTQAQLAKAAVVDVTTISAMESRKAATLRSGLDTIRAIMTALEAAGVELLAQGPGVRLKG
jgi:hypothetical protein